MIFRIHSIPILLALLGFALSEDATAAQHEARWALPPMVLEVKGKPVPPTPGHWLTSGRWRRG